MRWSKLFIPTLRADPAEADPRWKLLIRAGHVRRGDAGAELLFLGQRVIQKIAAQLRAAITDLGAQDVSLQSSLAHAMPLVAHGDLRSYKQLPQLWCQQRGPLFEVCGLGANATELRLALERAVLHCGLPVSSDDLPAREPEEFATPGVKTIADLTAFSGAAPSSQIKTLAMIGGTMSQGALIVVLVRGDHSLSEAKLRDVLGANAQPAPTEEIVALFGASPGSLGPVGITGTRILADHALRGRRNLICGANRDDYHLRFVTPGAHFMAEYFDLRQPALSPGDEGVPFATEGHNLVGHVRSFPAGLTVLNESGIATEPHATAAQISLEHVLSLIASQCCDDSGLIWPRAIAPFSVVFTPVDMRDETLRTTAERLYHDALTAGCDALLDDRDERAGVKFKDSELIGIPWRVTLGKKLAEGRVEVLERPGNVKLETSVDNAIAFIRDRWDQLQPGP